MRPGRVPWLAVSFLATLPLLALAPRLAPFLQALPPCPSRAFLGIPCLTCGMTRWAMALGHGAAREAFHWHPVATLLLGLAPLAAAWDLHRAWRNRPYPALPQGLGWRLGAVGLLALAWALQVARGI